jgi:hypothetical protein
MFLATRLVFGSIEGTVSSFHVLRSLTHFWWYGGRHVQYSHFVVPDSFLAVLGAPCPVFIFCAPGLVFSDFEGGASSFNILRSRTCFRRYGGRRVQILIFALSGSFWAVPRASGPVFMFCASELILDGTEGVV